MRKFISTLLLTVISLGSQGLHAEGRQEVELSFWDKLRAKIEQVVPQKKVTATTAVGGVRGAKVAADDVYWKGEKVAQAVDEDELEAFKSAMALASSGELAKALSAFAEFVEKNPQSALRKDADLALLQLQAAGIK